MDLGKLLKQFNVKNIISCGNLLLLARKEGILGIVHELLAQKSLTKADQLMDAVTLQTARLVPEKTINLGKCQVDFYPHFFSEVESKIIYDKLAQLDYQYTNYFMFGRFTKSPRKMLWFADNPKWTYFFSNNHVGGLPAQKWPPFLLEIKTRVEYSTGKKFNACLVNEYKGGDNKIDWHDDDDKWLGTDFIVPSLSFGAVRKFMLRLKSDRKKQTTLATSNGSMMVMLGNVQKYCHHAIPKETAVKGTRYNLTFRWVHPELVNLMPKGSKKALP